MTTSDAIAFAALVVSIYTIISSEVKSRKSDREQKVIKDEQDRLRKLLLEKETKSAINEMKAELGARLVKIAKNNYRLKIFNRGRVEARNIGIHIRLAGQGLGDGDTLPLPTGKRGRTSRQQIRT